MNRVTKTILGISAVAILLGVAFFAGWMMKERSYQSKEDKIVSALDTVTENMRSKKYDEAYAAFSEDYKAIVSQEQFNSFADEMNKIEGNTGAISIYADRTNDEYIATLPIFEGEKNTGLLIYNVDIVDGSIKIVSVST